MGGRRTQRERSRFRRPRRRRPVLTGRGTSSGGRRGQLRLVSTTWSPRGVGRAASRHPGPFPRLAWRGRAAHASRTGRNAAGGDAGGRGGRVPPASPARRRRRRRVGDGGADGAPGGRRTAAAAAATAAAVAATTGAAAARPPARRRVAGVCRPPLPAGAGRRRAGRPPTHPGGPPAARPTAILVDIAGGAAGPVGAAAGGGMGDGGAQPAPHGERHPPSPGRTAGRCRGGEPAARPCLRSGLACLGDSPAPNELNSLWTLVCQRGGRTVTNWCISSVLAGTAGGTSRGAAAPRATTRLLRALRSCVGGGVGGGRPASRRRRASGPRRPPVRARWAPTSRRVGPTTRPSRRWGPVGPVSAGAWPPP